MAGLVESNGRAAGDQMHVRTGFMEKSGKINRRSSSTDDRNSPSLETSGPCVLGAVRNQLPRHAGKFLRDVSKVSNAGRNHHPFRMDNVSASRGQLKAAGRPLFRDDVGLFHLRNKALLELQAVGNKGLNGNRKANVRVGKG